MRLSKRFGMYLVWLMFAVSTCFAAVTVGLAVAEQGTPLPRDLGGVSVLGEMTFALMIVAFSVLGALITSRRPNNKIGWILCVSPMLLAFTGVVRGLYIYDFFVEPGALHISPLVYWTANWAWAPGFLPMLTFLLLIFPDGKLPSRRWRVVALFAAVAIALLVLGYSLSDGPLEDYPRVDNPVGIEGSAGTTMEVLLNIGFPIFAVAAVLAMVSLVHRYRRSLGEERQQLKWMASAAALVVVAWLINAALDQIFGINSAFVLPIALTALPAAAAVAVLRYRLYDLEFVVNRALVYAGLSATLTAVYLGLVLLLQLMVEPVTSESDLAVAGSTLAVAALFRPARRRLQGWVDKRFYRRRFDAARTVETFNTRLREEIALDSLSAELCAVVAETMQPAHVSLWLQTPIGMRPPAADRGAGSASAP